MLAHQVWACPTKIVLPNAEATNPASRTFYDRIGLNDREIQLIQTGLAKRDYYAASGHDRRAATRPAPLA